MIRLAVAFIVCVILIAWLGPTNVETIGRGIGSGAASLVGGGGANRHDDAAITRFAITKQIGVIELPIAAGETTRTFHTYRGTCLSWSITRGLNILAEGSRDGINWEPYRHGPRRYRQVRFKVPVGSDDVTLALQRAETGGPVCRT